MTRGGKRKGAGRKPLYNKRTVTLSASVPPELDQAVRRKAKQSDKSVSQVITEILTKAFY